MYYKKILKKNVSEEEKELLLDAVMNLARAELGQDICRKFDIANAEFYEDTLRNCKVCKVSHQSSHLELYGLMFSEHIVARLHQFKHIKYKRVPIGQEGEQNGNKENKLKNNGEV